MYVESIFYLFFEFFIFFSHTLYPSPLHLPS